MSNATLKVFFPLVLFAILFFPCLAVPGEAETSDEVKEIWDINYEKIPCCQYADYPEVIWYGTDNEMDFERLASYVAPVLWFSPDEPLLKGKSGLNITIPDAFPFEEDSGKSTGYFRLRTTYHTPGAEKPAFVLNKEDKGKSIIYLDRVQGVDLDYFFYYPTETGFGSHPHDLEPAFFKVVVWTRNKCGACPYALVMINVRAPAHLVKWYANELDLDDDTQYPVHLFVEEGKHANCPDKNADGYYTPGFDVTERVNDAWGVRDTLATGHQFSASFKTYMAKVRQDSHRVFPPLPSDSPLRANWSKALPKDSSLMLQWSMDSKYAPEYNKYELRPLPSAKKVEDPHLKKVMMVQTDKDPEWPKKEEGMKNPKKFRKWMEDDSFARGISLAMRVDSKSLGLSLIWPLLITRHLELPFGGYLVPRFYTVDEFRDYSVNLLYAPSASRFVDWYLAMGWEGDHEEVNGVSSFKNYFMSEGGLKFRANLKLVKGAFLINWITDWWGLRLGVKQKGFSGFSSLGWVIEVGGGAF